MDATKRINIGGKDIEFMLGIEPSLHLYTWVATVDDLWLAAMSGSLFKTIQDHPLYFTNKSMSGVKNFAASATFESFKSLLTVGESDRFKGYIMSLYDVLMNRIGAKDAGTMVVGFQSPSNVENAVTAVIEITTNKIVIGAHLDSSSI